MTSNLLAQAAAPVDPLCPRHSHLDALLVRVGTGDRDAFSALYDELVQSVYAMSLSGAHDSSLASRITFDVFLCAWLQAGSYDPKVESAWTWVRAIASVTINAQSRTSELTRAVPSGSSDIIAVEPEPNHV